MKRIALIALSLCLVFSLSACDGLGLFQDKDRQAQEVLWDALTSRDADQIIAQCSKASLTNVGEEAIRAKLEAVDQYFEYGSVGYENMHKDKEASDANHTVYNAKLSLDSNYGPIEGDTTVSFVKEDDAWKIDWSPAAIFPGLTDENEVVVEPIPAKRGTIYDRTGKQMALDGPEGREYPYGSVVSPLVGYVRQATTADLADNSEDFPVQLGAPLGRVGLEKVFQKELAGTWGAKVFLSDQPENILAETESSDGEDVYTTIDMQAQEICFNRINGEYGSAVMIEPQTGGILAAVSTPSYAPEMWLDDALDDAAYRLTLENGAAPMEGNFSQIFLPGSTQKLMTSIIGLNEGVIDTTSQTGYEIYGSRWQPDTSWGGYTVHRVIPINGWITLHQALISSDNIFFARVGLDLGAEKFEKGMRGLGIGEEVPGRMPITTATIAEGNDLAEKPIALADSSYGQAKGMISPMQLTMTYAAMVDGGNILVPRILLKDKPEVWKESITSPANIKFINEAFTEVVAQTHPAAWRDYGTMAGKTGTAEVGPEGKQNLGWFVGYDLKNPTACLSVMINNVENRGGSDVNCYYFGYIMDDLYKDGPYKAPKIAAAALENAEE